MSEKTTDQPAPQQTDFNWRRWIYPALLAIIYFSYFSYMTLSESWGLFEEHWPVSLTMTGGSFIAGATAEGGAAVAFPVFTKVLEIPAPDARTFGLMIQAVGMTTAGVVIIAQRIPILPEVILWVTLGGAIGQVLGTFLIVMPNPYPRLLFTFIAAAFGLALALSRWVIIWDPRTTVRRWHGIQKARFVGLGIAGGIFAAQTGSGIDMLTFIVLTLAFGINEKISTPTTVIIMGLNSIVGAFLHIGIKQDVGVVWEYWLVAVPIVILGAPLGATVASYLKRDHIIIFLLTLITIEVFTTIWLVPIALEHAVITGIAVLAFVAWFFQLLAYRKRVIAPMKRTMEMQALSLDDLKKSDTELEF
ncbi:MAG: sulfite exporter TauE/SafE family protein [Anaerolineales bacterium]